MAQSYESRHNFAMPKRIPHEERESVVQIVAALAEGGSLEEITTALAKPIPRRTLQRWVSELVAEMRLVPEGKGPARRYRVPTIVEETLVEETLVEETLPAKSQVALTVSSEAQAVRQMVRLPLHQREPVGYNRKFLDAYRPNETLYLSPNLREKLASAGHTSDEALPAGTYAREIFNRLLIDLSWNSSRLEGNTYSLLETETLLQLGERAEGKAAEETQMILNHKAAIEILVEQAGDIGFNRYTILNLHGLLSDNLLKNLDAGGRLRARPVDIGGTVFHPLQAPQIIEECFSQILATAEAIDDSFEQAFFVMVHLPYLQPFEDVNKRVSRLAANIPLIRRNLRPLSFVDVPVRDYIDGLLGVYELNRVEMLRDVFVWAYERSCQRYAAVRQSLGEPDPFRLRYRQQLKEIVGNAVRRALTKKAAAAFIQHQSAMVPEEDRARFIEVAETEMQSLHEGNFARYRVRPAEFEAWRKKWR